MKQAASEYMESIAHLGSPQSFGDQLNVIDEKLARMRSRRDNFVLPNSGVQQEMQKASPSVVFES